MTGDRDSRRTVAFADVEAASERLDDESVVKRTPVERSTSLGELTGGEVYLKMEHLQWTGSSKTRGAYNKIRRCVEEDGVDQVVAASAGNHAQGVALAATTLGVDSVVVMPRDAPQAKVEATRGYGAEVELVGRDFREATAHAWDLVEAAEATWSGPELDVGEAYLVFEVETSGAGHARNVIRSIRDSGYEVRHVNA